MAETYKTLLYKYCNHEDALAGLYKDLLKRKRYALSPREADMLLECFLASLENEYNVCFYCSKFKLRCSVCMALRYTKQELIDLAKKIHNIPDYGTTPKQLTSDSPNVPKHETPSNQTSTSKQEAENGTPDKEECDSEEEIDSDEEMDSDDEWDWEWNCECLMCYFYEDFVCNKHVK